MNERTDTCGSLTSKDIGKKVLLKGWIQKNRDLGGLSFIVLRDRYGLTQILIDPEKEPDLHKESSRFRSEWVLEVEGIVQKRAEGMENKKMVTGDIEVAATSIRVLSEAETPPIEIADHTDKVNEETRLINRCLDMRRGKIINNLKLRHKVQLLTRTFLDTENFIEVQTPILGKSTPETGARDYLVPSRLYPGSVFALPQSPQIYKQLLMVGGLDRYFQIAPCFRDEDLRADRQPEFTQIDLELSFCSVETLYTLIENLVKKIFQELKGITLPTPFPRLTYQEAMEYYGTDKPDRRFKLPLVRIHECVALSSASFLQKIIDDEEGAVKALVLPNESNFSRKRLDSLTHLMEKSGASGLGFLKWTEEGIKGSLLKFFSEEALKSLQTKTGFSKGDIIFIIGEKESITNKSLDVLRRTLAKEEGLIPENCFDFTWITQFPLFHENKEEGCIESEHHPFTAPLDEDLELLTTAPYKVRSLAYDLVAQGYEIGGGSRRIHDPKLQKQIFDILQLSEDQIERRFGFFLKNFKYGTPPHLGIALGLDRLLMILSGTDNIRDVIAFPKTTQAQDLLTNSPSKANPDTLRTLSLKVIE